jgi:hypothetical protein
VTAEGGYTIPNGNLFPKDGAQGRPEIYAMGCRNPWRMSVDEKTGIVYWGEVGPDAGGDNARGPRGYDEINQAKKPGNFGWPFFVGSNFAYAHYDFATRKAGEKYDPTHPVNDGINNTGSKVLPPAMPASSTGPTARPRISRCSVKAGARPAPDRCFTSNPASRRRRLPRAFRQLPAVLRLAAALHEVGAAGPDSNLKALSLSRAPSP